MERLRKTLIIILAAVMLIGAAHFGQVDAEAKTRRTMVTDQETGHTYGYKDGVMRKGWFTYHGKRYYAHHSKSALYPEGSVTKNAFREKNGKLYYFDGTGAKITRSTKYIILNRHSTSVHYILTPGQPNYRYNVNHRRYQEKVHGRWRDVGMQCLPVGQIDFQW